METLYHQFVTSPKHIRALEQKLCREHQRLSERLEKEERTLLLRLMDLESEILDEECLHSFICGYRLACGIQQELWTRQPHSHFEDDDEHWTLETLRRGETGHA